MPDLPELGQRPGQVQPAGHQVQAFPLVERLQGAHGAVGGGEHDPGQLDLIPAEQPGGLAELRPDGRAVNPLAGGIEEAEQQYLAAQAGQRHRLPVLAGQRESWSGIVQLRRRAGDGLGQDRVGVRADLRE